MSEFQQKILDKILEKSRDTYSQVKDMAHEVDRQGKTLDKINPKISNISTSTTKIETTVITVSEKVKEGLANNKETSKDFKKALTTLNKQYNAMIIDGLNHIPKNMKESIKEDRSLLRDILATVNVANQKLNKIGSNSRSIKAKAENLDGKNNVVVNITANGPTSPLAATSLSSEESTKQLYEIKAILRVMANNMKPNRLKDKEDKEDMMSSGKNKKEKEKKDKEGKKDNQSSGFNLGSMTTPFTLLASLIAGRFALSEGGYENPLLRAGKLSTGLMQKGGISKLADIYKGTKGFIERQTSKFGGGLAKDVAGLADKEVLKEVAESSAKVAEKTLAKSAKSMILKEFVSVGKLAAREGSKLATKTIGKKLPIIGLGIGAVFAAQRAKEGDFWGAGLELASGIASLIPGIGTMVSVGLDGILVARDISRNSKHISEEMRSAAEASERFASIMMETAEQASATGKDSDIKLADLAGIKSESYTALQALPEVEKKLNERISDTKMDIPWQKVQTDLGKVLENQTDLTPEGIRSSLEEYLSKSNMTESEKEYLRNSDELVESLRLKSIIERNKKLEMQYPPETVKEFDEKYRQKGVEKQQKELEDYKKYMKDFSAFFSKYTIERVDGEDRIRNTKNNELLSLDESRVLLEEANDLTKKVEHIMNTPLLKVPLQKDNPELFDYMENLYKNFRYGKTQSPEDKEMERMRQERGLPPKYNPNRPTMDDFEKIVTSSVLKTSAPFRQAPNVSTKEGLSTSIQDVYTMSKQRPQVSVNPYTTMNTTTISNSSPTLLQPLMQYGSDTPLFWNSRNS